MPRDGQDLNAIESMSKLMGRICPALHKAPITRKPGLPKVEDVTFVALYLDKRTPPNESRLTLHPEGMALSVESRDCIPAGNYQFHIYDTTFEAVAALRALEAVGFMDTVERFELPAGEGVIMIRCGDDPGRCPRGAMLQHGAELSETVHSFEGQGGQVCINLIDNRLDLTAETGGFSRTRQAFLSISFPRGDVCRILHDDKARHSDTHKRGHLLARMVAASCRTPSALRFCQRSLETITGALVPGLFHLRGSCHGPT